MTRMVPFIRGSTQVRKHGVRRPGTKVTNTAPTSGKQPLRVTFALPEQQEATHDGKIFEDTTKSENVGFEGRENSVENRRPLDIIAESITSIDPSQRTRSNSERQHWEFEFPNTAHYSEAQMKSSARTDANVDPSCGIETSLVQSLAQAFSAQSVRETPSQCEKCASLLHQYDEVVSKSKADVANVLEKNKTLQIWCQEAGDHQKALAQDLSTAHVKLREAKIEASEAHKELHRTQEACKKTEAKLRTELEKQKDHNKALCREHEIETERRLREAYEEWNVQRSELETRLRQVQGREETAVVERQNLLQMLELSVVPREGGVTPRRRPNSPATSAPAFPNGVILSKLCENYQAEAVDLFWDLTDLFVSKVLKHSKKLEAGDYQQVFNWILVPCGRYAKDSADDFVTRKAQQLGEFMGDPEFHRGDFVQQYHAASRSSLISLFWSQMMQKACMDHFPSKTAEHDDSHLEWWDPTGSFLPTDHYVEWAFDACSKHSEDMDGRHVSIFLRNLVELYLYARCSQPRCFLYPDVGQKVDFSPMHHEQEHLPTHRRKARTGETVLTLFPGLYYDDPSGVDPSGRTIDPPVVKPIVVLFPRQSSDRGEDDLSSIEEGPCNNTWEQIQEDVLAEFTTTVAAATGEQGEGELEEQMWVHLRQVCGP